VEQPKRQTDQAEKGRWGETPVKLANIMRASRQDSQEIILLKQAVVGIAALSANVSLLSGRMTEQLSRVVSRPTGILNAETLREDPYGARAFGREVSETACGPVASQKEAQGQRSCRIGGIALLQRRARTVVTQRHSLRSHRR
jgi:hypothetical protein